MARSNTCQTSSTDLYASLGFCAGETSLPGIRKKVYFIQKSYIAKFPEINGGAYTGSFTLVSGKFFKYIEVVVDNSKFTAASQGNYPNKTFKQHLEMLHPILDADFAAFQAKANNDDFIYILQDADGKFKVLGCEQYRTDTTFSDDSGQQATDSCGSTITAECDAPTGLLEYSGDIMTGEEENANDQE